ncbi:type IX secretion system membrane protein PorP/SprF, partial [Flavobacterium sp. LMO6]|nr:type IX secretion system membrane protein PorP/SprF [Flavobacterium sp. LMO6]
MKNRIIQVVILFIGVVAFAQQDPHYTQYMYNMSVMNPA